MSDLFTTTSAVLPFDLPSGPGYATVWDEQWKGYRITVPDGQLFYASEFFPRKISDRTVEYFQENDTVNWRTTRFKDLDPDQFSRIRFDNIAWKQDVIRLYGKEHRLPRLTSWYGDSGKEYTYSGIRSRPNTWNKGLLYIKEKIELCAGVPFNSVLLNWYRDGSDHLSWHSDDEKELGLNPIIASANFGATRDFVLRRKDNEKVKIAIPLSHGTVLIMRGALQHHWHHAVPKRARVTGSRFNLTFRRIGIPD